MFLSSAGCFQNHHFQNYNLYVDEFILRKITKNANLFHRSRNITFVLLKNMVISTSGYNQFAKIYSTCVQHSMYKYENKCTRDQYCFVLYNI